ncbi:hypothetical protein [Halorubrum salinum]|uniref:hypothetical protein n=1 Tax=Halorubrum salinum TaxID=767517 RepID=UPI002111D12D|nr:hypothetical protein [Halorubrum salinum]
MSGSGLLDTVLASQQRVQEAEVERDDAFLTWVRRLNTESEVLLKRIKALDFSEGEDRDAFYELIGKMRERFKELRERDEIGEVPIDVVMKFDDLLEELEGTSQPAVVAVTTLGSKTPAQRERDKRRRKEREEKHERIANERAKAITDALSDVYDALPDDK